MDDPLIEKLDREIDELELQLKKFEDEVYPIKKKLELLGDVRRRLTGLTSAPSREGKIELEKENESLKEELVRLRGRLLGVDEPKKRGVTVVKKAREIEELQIPDDDQFGSGKLVY